VARIAEKLTEIAVKNAQPGQPPRRDGRKSAKPGSPYKLSDGRGLYLLVLPDGLKLWRVNTRLHGKQRTFALGAYPDVPLKGARAKCREILSKVAEGIDPVQAKRAEALRKAVAAANTFKAVAKDYVDSRRDELDEVTIRKAEWLADKLSEKIGRLPITAISPQELLAALQIEQNKGNRETARRMRSFAGRVFRYAIVTGRADRDPSQDLKGAIKAPRVTHRAAILDPTRVGELLRSIDGYTGHLATRLALQLAPHVFVRPGELRNAEWGEIDLDHTVWVIPAEKTKMKKEHRVPLSRQALAILNEAKGLTGKGRLVFPSPSASDKPLSENTFNKVLRTLGYASDEMSAHGFRSTASSLLNESGKWSPDAIERALAHGDADGVRAAYNRGEYWKERTAMAQWWSDYLDTLKLGAKFIPFPGKASEKS
jgi:integrase